MSMIRMVTGGARLSASAEGSLRKFALDAYNGGPMMFEWSDVPVIVDIAGIEIGDKPRPVLLQHDDDRRVGHTVSVIAKPDALFAEGVVSGAGEAAKEVVDAADRGFPWQCSIGVMMQRREMVAAGQSIEVNGRTVSGPALIVRASALREISFVTLGADDSTAGRMTAAAGQPGEPKTPKETPMDFNAWLSSLGFDPAALSTEALAVLQKAYDAEMEAAKAAADKKEDAPAKAAAAKRALLAASAEVAKMQAGKPVASPDLTAARKAAADESRRIAGVRKLCAGSHPEIEAQAIEEGWSMDKTELTVLRASRAQAPAIHGSTASTVTGDVLQAAIMQSARTPGVDKHFSDKTLEAASKTFRGRLGLGELLIEAARANGYTGRAVKVDGDVLRAAFGMLHASGFSTVDIGGILSNVANKFLLDGFANVEQSWKQIAAIRSVSDFKTVTSYRLTGAQQYEKVGPSGEIKSGDLGEESYTNKADTYGKMFAITRRDIINDDLGALTDVPRMLGRGAALKLNDVFWTAFMADGATFYTTARKNYFEGAATNLQISSLTTAVQMFRDQTDDKGKPLGISPSLLIVPTALEVVAENLFNGANLVVGALGATNAKAIEPNVNPHARKYKPVVSAYLGNTSYTGNSSTAWYLAADPRDLAVIEVAFLNGQESPTVEQAEADFSTLGIQMRGFHDFGVNKQDYRAAVKSKGAA